MQWFKHLKTQNKLFLTFGTLVALMIFSNLFAISQFAGVNKEYNTLLTTSVQRFVLLNRAVEDITKLRLQNVYLFETGVYTDSIQTIIDSFLNNMKDYRDMLVSDELLSEEEMQIRLNIWQDIHDRFTNMYIPYQQSIYSNAVRNEKKISMDMLRGARIESEMTNNFEKLRHDAITTIKKKSDDATSHFNKMIDLAVITALCIITFSALLSILITRTVKTSIVHIQQAMVEISKGNLNYPIRSEFRDELGRLTHDIGDMIDSITEMNKTIAVMEHLDSMICIVDADYRIIYMNEQMAVSYDLDKASCINKKCYEILWQRDEPCPHCLLPHVGEKGANQSHIREHFWDETQGKWLGSKSAIIPWIDGSLVQFTSFTDETANKIQEELRREKMLAEAASKSKSDFLATMSHEIRTPMNAVLGITEILLANEALPQDTLEGLDKIYAAGDLLLGIINNILDLSKIEAGKLELATARYDVASLLYDVAQLNVMRIGSKPIEFELHADENTPAEVVGDVLRVKQILNNLLSNAFKYTAAGVVKLSVTVESESAEKETEVMLVFNVSDTGQGMTEDQISHLGDEYSRFNMDANRTTEGTGLGMSITKNLVRMMNGKLFVDSEPGRGSTFTVRLPQIYAGPGVLGNDLVESLRQFRMHSMEHMKSTHITCEPMPYGNVLIVDDVETNLYVSQGLMKPYRLQIETATSGFEAIEKIRSGKTYDIVFMDHMMPNMDGMEATKILRSLGYTRPIVALTANAVVGQAAVFLANGFDHFIFKPIDLRQLDIVLNTLVRDKQSPEVIEAARQEAGDFAHGNTGDKAGRQLDPQLAASFVRDATRAIAALETACGNGAADGEEGLHLYIVNAHAMNSALRNIGETTLSAFAFRLEQAGREGDLAVIAAETPAFLNALRTVTRKIELKDEAEFDDAKDEDQTHLRVQLLALHTMCTEYDIGAAENTLSELRQKPWSRQTRELLNALTEHLLHSDLDEAASIAKGYAESIRVE